MDDIELPPLPIDSYIPQPGRISRAPTNTYPRRLLLRKRTHSDYDNDGGNDDTANSSDPALFSGDESAPGLENYSGRRKKKMYTGSWWNHRMHAGKAVKKKEFKRNFDSGIFMGSEGSDVASLPSSDSLGLEDELLQDQKRRDAQLHKQQEEERWAGVLRRRPGMPKPALVTEDSSAADAEQDDARTIIRKCLEQGIEDVDLASMSLLTLPSEIADLATLTKQTNIVEGMLDAGTSFEVQLRLYLGNNLLTRLPRPLLDLTNLRTLSLRRNSLETIPAGIRNLVNLETLNVSANNLNYLPFEVVELVRFHSLRTITADPNPWILPTTDLNQDVWSNYDERCGTYLRLLRTSVEPATVSMPTTLPLNRHKSTIPSLLETVLRQLSRTEPKDELSQYMPPDTSEKVLTALEAQRAAQQEGGRQCTACKRSIVWPAIEWLEWWNVAQGSKPMAAAHLSPMKPWGVSFPVKRAKCSVNCQGTKSDWADKFEDNIGNAAAVAAARPCTGSPP